MESTELKDESRALLADSCKKFTSNFFLKLRKMKNPSTRLRNLILVFLTIFHDELDELVDGLSEE